MTAVLDPGQGSAFVLGAYGNFTYTPDPSITGPVTYFYHDYVGGVPGLTTGVITLLFRAQQPKLTLKDVRFNGAYAIIPDAGGPAYRTGWNVTNPPNQKNPLAYYSGQVASITVTLSVDHPEYLAWADLRLLPTWQNMGFVLGNGRAVVNASRSEVTLTNASLSAGLAGVYDNYSTQWTLERRVGSITNLIEASGQSQNRIYTLYKAPAAGALFYHTVVRVGTLAASGLATQDQVVQAVMNKFATLQVKQVNTTEAQNIDNGRTLTYYNNWKADTNGWRYTSTLLIKGDGDCEAWTRFFLDVLKTQGITFDRSAFKLGPPDATKGPIFVKQWNAGAVRYQFADRPINYVLQSYNFVRTNATGTPQAGGTKGANIAGQGNPAPLAMFKTHEVAWLVLNGNPILFDPSYGRTFTTPKVGTPAEIDNALLLAWQNGSLTYIGGGPRRPRQNLPLLSRRV